MKKHIPLLAALVIGVIAAYAMWGLTAPQPQQEEVTIGGHFLLLNQEDKTVSDADYKGRLMLVYFGFTYCPDICPMDISVMSKVMAQLGPDAAKVAPIFITVDPERDTPKQLKDYLANFKPPVEGLTGDRKAIDAVIKAYKVYAQKVPRKDVNDYTMDHSAFMYLMGKDGKYLTHFAHGTSPAEIATEVRNHL